MCPFKEFLLWFSVAAGCVRSSRGLWPGALFDGSLYVHRLTVNRCCQAIETSVACSPVNAAQTTSIQSVNPSSQPRANFIRIACRAAADTLLTCRIILSPPSCEWGASLITCDDCNYKRSLDTTKLCLCFYFKSQCRLRRVNSESSS